MTTLAAPQEVGMANPFLLDERQERAFADVRRECLADLDAGEDIPFWDGSRQGAAEMLAGRFPARCPEQRSAADDEVDEAGNEMMTLALSLLDDWDEPRTRQVIRDVLAAIHALKAGYFVDGADEEVRRLRSLVGRVAALATIARKAGAHELAHVLDAIARHFSGRPDSTPGHQRRSPAGEQINPGRAPPGGTLAPPGRSIAAQPLVAHAPPNLWASAAA